MGFRFPLDTAADVDTRVTPGGAGVQVYQDNSVPTAPRGIVDFSDGWSGDRDALIYQHSEADTHAQSRSASGGLTLDGGAYLNGAVSAPKLTLDVVSTGVGTGAASAKLTGAPLDVDQPITSSAAGQQWTDLPIIAGAYTPWDTGANMPRYRRDAAGLCHIRGIVKITSSFSIAAGATATVANMPAGYYLAGVITWDTGAVLSAAGVLTAVTQMWVTSTGALTVYNNSAATWGTGFGIVLGMRYPTT